MSPYMWDFSVLTKISIEGGFAGAASNRWWWSRWHYGFDLSQQPQLGSYHSTRMHSLTFPRSGDLGTWQDWEQSDSSSDPTARHLPLYRAYRSFSLHIPKEAFRLVELARRGEYGNHLHDPGPWYVRASWPSSQRPEKLGMFQQGPVSTSLKSDRDSDFRRARRAGVPALDLSDSEMGGSRRNYRRETPTRTLHHTWGTR